MMRELCGNAHNEHLLIADGGALIPSAELILMLSEPVYNFDPQRGMTARRKTTEVRFSADAPRIRNLASALSDIADNLERHALTYGRVAEAQP